MSDYRLLKASILGLPLCLAAAGAQAQQQPAADAAKNLKPVTSEMLRNPPAADWLMWRRTYDGFGYSPLDQINKDNVKTLKPAWTWSLVNGPTETTPIVHDGVLFVNTIVDKIQALNATTGDLIWEYKRDLPTKLLGENTNQLTKRNMAIYGDNLYIATSDAHIVALDAKTGKVVFDYTVADWTKGWRYSGGPFIANGKLIQGMTGCGNATPGGCFITGHDVKTGAELWRVHTIAQPGDAGYDTWNGIPIESRFGSSAWISGSYDPEHDLVFYGTGQPYPWIAEMNGLLPKKPGVKNNALYTDSTLAIDPNSGKVKWYRQHLETDTWDLDYAYERMLIDLPVDGVTRKALVTTGKLGIIEAIDRTNGEWLWHKETIPQNVVTAIDPKTGEKTINQASVPHIGQTTVNCPADPGGRAIFARTLVPNSDGNVGRVDAIKLADRSTVWTVRTRTPQTGAVLPTGGGVVFGGGWDRWFRAYDDTTGKVLWEIRLNNALNSFPITYSVNGKQYVAVVAGNGSSHARSLATLTPEIKNPDGGSVLWVFALPD